MTKDSGDIKLFENWKVGLIWCQPNERSRSHQNCLFLFFSPLLGYWVNTAHLVHLRQQMDLSILTKAIITTKYEKVLWGNIMYTLMVSETNVKYELCEILLVIKRAMTPTVPPLSFHAPRFVEHFGKYTYPLFLQSYMRRLSPLPYLHSIAKTASLALLCVTTRNNLYVKSKDKIPIWKPKWATTIFGFIVSSLGAVTCWSLDSGRLQGSQ